MLSALVFLAAVGVSHAHICTFDPPQRGPAVPRDIGPGYKACYVRTEAACLALPPTPNPRKVYTGFPFTVEMQQNLNHWTQGNPGSIYAYFQDAQGNNYPNGKEMISDYPARDMIMQTNLNVTVTAGKDVPTGPVVLFLRYQSNNPGEVDPANNTQAIFYQCIDLNLAPISELEGESEVARVESRRVRDSRDVPATSCVADFGFVAYGDGSDGSSVTISWDMANNRTRFDTTQADGTVVSRLTDYNSGLEFRFTEADQSCSLFGPDPPYPWAYGPSMAMNTDQIVKNQVTTVYYSNPSNGISWTAVLRDDMPGSCYPDTVTYPDGTKMSYNGVVPTNFPEGDQTFVPPAYCHPSNPRVEIHASCNPINIARRA